MNTSAVLFLFLNKPVFLKVLVNILHEAIVSFDEKKFMLFDFIMPITCLFMPKTRSWITAHLIFGVIANKKCFCVAQWDQENNLKKKLIKTRKYYCRMHRPLVDRRGVQGVCPGGRVSREGCPDGVWTQRHKPLIQRQTTPLPPWTE